ncbi:hypothetical protein BC938DRAFT_480634 [Jimgerdemannia flammicorona]|uniref:Uncharacterized protein n=1 Tax=Jimgerdemannia flammicorona TaxID=994334 RepID=A0A433QX62_9FUNG|nr:hypothetical protein BC938DRAFT_480634 [Jimgerdemannia flammicorona]
MPTQRKRTKFHIWFKNFLLASFIAFVIFAALAVSWYIWRNKSSTSPPESHVEMHPDLKFNISFQKVSFDDLTFQIYFEFAPFNNFTDANRTLLKRIKIRIDDVPQIIRVNSTAKVWRGWGSSANLHGSPGDYPFDEWEGQVLFDAAEDIPSHSATGQNITLPPAKPKMQIAINYDYPSLYGLTAMWVIISLYTFLTMKFLFFIEKNPQYVQEIIGYSSLGAAMLFAMSSVRSAQPGVPTIACFTDI